MKTHKYNLILSESRKPVLVNEKTYHITNTIIETPEDAAIVADRIFHLTQQAEEKAIMICMDIRNRPTCAFEISHGNCRSTHMGIREVFIRALLAGAVQIIVLHNHPSGDPLPSPEDWISFLQLQKAGQLLGIPVLDHIIIGDGKIFSMETESVDSQDTELVTPIY